MAVVVVVAVVAVWRSGLPGLAVTGPIVAFATSIPSWFPRVFPDAAALDSESAVRTDAGVSLGIPATVAPSQASPAHSPLQGLPMSSMPGEQKVNPPQSGPERREVGSSEFADLVYALAVAMPDQGRIIRVVDLAGLDRGIIDDGFVDASTRWYAALRHAVESGQEEALCREALRASPSKPLRAAVTAYLA